MSLAIQPLLPVFKRMFFVEIKYHYNNGAKFKLQKSTVENSNNFEL